MGDIIVIYTFVSLKIVGSCDLITLFCITGVWLCVLLLGIPVTVLYTFFFLLVTIVSFDNEWLHFNATKKIPQNKGKFGSKSPCNWCFITIISSVLGGNKQHVM